MSTGVKIVLGIVAGVVLLCGGGIGAAYLWLDNNKDDLKRMGEESIAEAKAFGQAHSGDDCVQESLRRHDSCDGFMCEVKNNIFLEQCLKHAAQVDPARCTGVPSESEIVASAGWRIEQCKAVNRLGDDACGRLFGSVQKYCDSVREGDSAP